MESEGNKEKDGDLQTIENYGNRNLISEVNARRGKFFFGVKSFPR